MTYFYPGISGDQIRYVLKNEDIPNIGSSQLLASALGCRIFLWTSHVARSCLRLHLSRLCLLALRLYHHSHLAHHLAHRRRRLRRPRPRRSGRRSHRHRATAARVRLCLRKRDRGYGQPECCHPEDPHLLPQLLCSSRDALWRRWCGAKSRTPLVRLVLGAGRLRQSRLGLLVSATHICHKKTCIVLPAFPLLSLVWRRPPLMRMTHICCPPRSPIACRYFNKYTIPRMKDRCEPTLCVKGAE